jgi:hypothetical protein
MSRLDRPLRLLAIAGPAVVLLWQLLTLPPTQPRQGVGLAVLAIFTPAVGLVLLTLLRPALALLLRHGDLLVPLGLYVIATHVTNALLALPALAAVATPSWSIQLLGLGLSLSLGIVLQVALAVAYAAWVTRLVLQAVEDDRTDLVGALAGPWQLLGRVFVAEAAGWVGLMALMVPAVALAGAALPVGLFAIGALSLAWNLATAALLPVVAASREPLARALAEGFRASWSRKRRWWYVVVVQVLLLGGVTFVSVSFTTSTGPGNFTSKNNTNWSVNGFWTGGYEDSCRWYGAAAAAYETQTLPLVTALLGIVFAVLAVAVKLRVVRDLRPTAAPDRKEGPGPAYEQDMEQPPSAPAPEWPDNP